MPVCLSCEASSSPRYAAVLQSSADVSSRTLALKLVLIHHKCPSYQVVLSSPFCGGGPFKSRIGFLLWWYLLCACNSFQNLGDKTLSENFHHTLGLWHEWGPRYRLCYLLFTFIFWISYIFINGIVWLTICF